ncbi:hypothetical protein EsDP_00002076 [Epichloe bromicola]|uniref:MFS transporter n=1 Tax=Epichloe bromicola TaxID=79588 RepID=A0ABQ0CJS8_9HYPO
MSELRRLPDLPWWPPGLHIFRFEDKHGSDGSREGVTEIELVDADSADPADPADPALSAGTKAVVMGDVTQPAEPDLVTHCRDQATADMYQSKSASIKRPTWDFRVPFDHERRPLLVPREEDEYDDRDEYQQLPQDNFTTADRATVFVLLTLIVITQAIGTSLHNAAIYFVEYDINCRNHQPNSTATFPWLCDSDKVNAEFSTIEHWKGHLGLLVALLTAVPYGLAADRFSRRNLLALCTGGILISMAGEIIVCLFPKIFSLRLVWLATLFMFIGGGPLIFSALVFAIASDVSSHAQRNRVTVFFFIDALTTIATSLSQPLYTGLTNNNPWLAIYIGLATTCICTILVLFLPATRDVASLARLARREDAHIDDSDNFVSRLYSHGTSAAGLVGIVKLWSNLAVVTLVLPITSQILTRLHYNPLQRDLWLARGIVMAVVAGLLITGFSNGRAMVIIGTVLLSPDSAFIPVARSLLVLFNGEQHTGVLFTLVVVMQSLSLLIGLPFLEWLFKVGSHWGAAWYGLPFVVLAVLTAVAGGSVANLRIRELETEHQQRNEQDVA